MADWRNRIVWQGERDPRTLVKNPLNWRRHPKAQAGGLRATLDRIGSIAEVRPPNQGGGGGSIPTPAL